MIVRINIHDKSFGPKQLYRELSLAIHKGETIGIIGRNGTGKSTLLSMIAGQDTDYDGDIQISKSIRVISSRQEHHGFEDTPVFEYIVGDLPDFVRLKRILDTYPEKMGDNQSMIARYSDALDEFTQLGYFDIESNLESLLHAYQLPDRLKTAHLRELSGGQKRLIELIKVQLASAELALIDEPTNHMDYVAKAQFIRWLKDRSDASVVISHDRDVLDAVDRIVEIRDGQAESFDGSYAQYLKINTARMGSQINEYEVQQSKLQNRKDDVLRFQRLKERSRDPDTIKRFKNLEQKARQEVAQLSDMEKPSFWVDSDNVDSMRPAMAAKYAKHKAKNIRIGASNSGDERLTALPLIELEDLALGYDAQLFNAISVQIREGDRVELKGRNGVGKSTIVRSILQTLRGGKLAAQVFGGQIDIATATRIGVYEQEFDDSLLELRLDEAIERVYHKLDVPVTDSKIRSILSQYLFDPQVDGAKPLKLLSGGQRARYQLIAMLAGKPNVLILDEPTNHLDLPSIEELEKALHKFRGAIIFISHDSYFSKALNPHTVQITPLQK